MSDDEYERDEEEDQGIKQQIFDHFKNTGVLDNITANLRQEMIDQLNLTKRKDNKKDLTREDYKNMSYHEFIQTVISPMIISDFLKKQKANYSYSVFVPEMHIDPDSIFSEDEIYQELGIDNEEYDDFIDQIENKESLSVIQVLVFLASRKLTVKTTVNIQSQTDEKELTSGLRKLEVLDEQYIQEMDFFRVDNAQTLEQSMMKYKQDCDEMFKSSLEAEIQRLKNEEIRLLRDEEAKRYSEKLEFHIREMERSYQDRLKRLKQRQADNLEICKQRLEELDQMKYEMRQRYVYEIDELELQGKQYRRHDCLDNELVQKERQRLANIQKDLKFKIKAYDESQRSLQLQFESDLARKREEVRKECSTIQNFTATAFANRDIIQQRDLLRDRQRDALRILEICKNNLEKENENIKQEVIELQYFKTEKTKELNYLRDENKKLKQENETLSNQVECFEPNMNSLQQENIKIMEMLRDKNFTEREIRSQILNEIKQHDLDLQRNHQYYIEHEKTHNFQLDEQAQKHQHEIEQLQSDIYKLQSEVYILNRELQQKQNQEKSKESNSTGRQNTEEDYRQRLDQVFKDVEMLKSQKILK